MDETNFIINTMRALQLCEYGEPEDVLTLVEIPIADPGPERIRIAVSACGVNPVDWAAIARGMFSGYLPRGIGLEVSGIVDAIGEGVSDVTVGDAVLGVSDFINEASAGAADFANLMFWTPVPHGLDLVAAGVLPMATETAYRGLTTLGVEAGQTLLVHGAGTMVGYAAVQIALMNGAHVIASAGDTFAAQLRAKGAKVTPYGEGMVERVHDIIGGQPDLVLDTAPTSDGLEDLIRIVGNDPKRVVTVSHFEAVGRLGIRCTPQEPSDYRYDVIPRFAQLAADGKFEIPIAAKFALEDWRSALELYASGRPGGKLVILP